VTPTCVATTRRLATALLVAVLAGGAAVRAEEPTPELSNRPSTPAEPAPGAEDAAPAPDPVTTRAAPEPTKLVAPGPTKPDVKRVVYIPEAVKVELREQLRREVLETARREGWAVPGQVPEWLHRFRPSLDVRVRLERDMFPGGNANTGDFPDFNAINTGQPVDYSLNLADLTNDRWLNVDQSRTRPRLRALLGVDVDISSAFTVGLRLGTGESSSPVSANQTLGGSGSNFSRYQLWLDRAFVRWSPVGKPADLAVLVGRFENPFLTTELIWSESVNLDGLAGHWRVGGPLSGFINAGAFPIYTTPFAYPVDAQSKLPSNNRWLYAAQLGFGWTPSDDVSFKAAGAWYDFDGVEGRPSSPCDTSLKNTTCDTDDRRPGFAQKGNTYRPLRTPDPRAIVQEALGAPEYQYFGLASRFNELAVDARLELRLAGTLGVRLEGEYVKNLGFDRAAVAAVGINNLAPCPQSALTVCPYAGGDQGYIGRVVFSSLVKDEPGAWTATAAYRHLESDATLDAFTDSDFGLGGTNLKGYAATASVFLGRGVSLCARWYGADAVAGPTYRVDVVQLDLQARY
jgi:hypothetical protein